MSKPKWQRVGSMLASKNKEGSYYIKVEADIPAGSILQMEKPREAIEKMVERGIITQEEADERINKVPDFVKFNLVLPPPKSDDSF